MIFWCRFIIESKIVKNDSDVQSNDAKRPANGESEEEPSKKKRGNIATNALRDEVI